MDGVNVTKVLNTGGELLSALAVRYANSDLKDISDEYSLC